MKILPINNSILVTNKKSTFLSASVSAAATTITIESIKGFAVNQILLIGEIENEKSEIKHTHSSSAPSSSTVTLASALTFSHPQGTKIYIIDWDQVEISWAETKTGTKDVLTTINIQPDQKDTLYTDTAKASGFYFVRFKNSISNDFSDYSDPIPWEGFGDNTVGKIIQYALKRNKLKTFTDFIDYEFCIDEINSCLKYIKGKKKKWTHLQEFDYTLGQTARGRYSISLPNNIWKKSHKSVLDVRIGQSLSLKYADKTEWNDLMIGVVRTEVVSAGGDNIVVANSTGLRSSGNVMIEGKVIDYDSISGNTLQNVSDDDVTVGANVWQGAYQEGTPRNYTVYNEKLFWWPMTSSSKPVQNIMADFWKEAPEVDSDGDEIDVYRFDMIKHWLSWVIRMELKNDGIRTFEDGDYMQFRECLFDAMRGDIHGQRYKTEPKLNTIKYPSIRSI